MSSWPLFFLGSAQVWETLSLDILGKVSPICMRTEASAPNMGAGRSHSVSSPSSRPCCLQSPQPQGPHWGS